MPSMTISGSIPLLSCDSLDFMRARAAATLSAVNTLLSANFSVSVFGLDFWSLPLPSNISRTFCASSLLRFLIASSLTTLSNMPFLSLGAVFSSLPCAFGIGVKSKSLPNMRLNSPRVNVPMLGFLFGFIDPSLKVSNVKPTELMPPISV